MPLQWRSLHSERRLQSSRTSLASALHCHSWVATTSPQRWQVPGQLALSCPQCPSASWTRSHPEPQAPWRPQSFSPLQWTFQSDLQEETDCVSLIITTAHKRGKNFITQTECSTKMSESVETINPNPVFYSVHAVSYCDVVMFSHIFNFSDEIIWSNLKSWILNSSLFHYSMVRSWGAELFLLLLHGIVRIPVVWATCHTSSNYTISEMDVYKHFEHSNAVVFSAQKNLLFWLVCVHTYMYACKHACDFTCSSCDSMIPHEVHVISWFHMQFMWFHMQFMQFHMLFDSFFPQQIWKYYQTRPVTKQGFKKKKIA